MTQIFEHDMIYVTCPDVLHEITLVHNSDGSSVRRMTVSYMCMERATKIWYTAVGVFDQGDPIGLILWQPTEWLACETRPPLRPS